MGVSAQCPWELHSMDPKTTFLQGHVIEMFMLIQKQIVIGYGDSIIIHCGLNDISLY